MARSGRVVVFEGKKTLAYIVLTLMMSVGTLGALFSVLAAILWAPSAPTTACPTRFMFFTHAYVPTAIAVGFWCCIGLVVMCVLTLPKVASKRGRYVFRRRRAEDLVSIRKPE